MASAIWTSSNRPTEEPAVRGGANPSLPTLRKGEPAMPRRFTQAIRAAEALGAVVAVTILAILFLPRLTSGGDAAPSGLEQQDLNVAVVPAVDSAGFFEIGRAHV